MCWVHGQRQVLVAKTHVFGLSERGKSMLKMCWVHGQRQVLASKAHGMRE